MEHPLLKSKKNLLIYSVMWFIITIIHITVVSFLYIQPLDISIIESLLFNVLNFSLGFFAWYSIRYAKTPNSYELSLNIIINHITTVLILSFISLGANYIIQNELYNKNSAYLDFFNHSLVLRYISCVFYFAIVTLAYYLIGYYNDFQEKLMNENRLKEIIKETELNLLKSQINPHFLFNSLNSISSLTITNPDKAQEMIIKLSDFLRYNVSQHENKFTSLSSELSNIKRYLDIEQIRFGNKLKYNTEIDDKSLEWQIPVMILQPLYENAVKHGVYESTETVVINTKFFIENNFLNILIKNNFDKSYISKKGTGTGIKNIQERLKLIYFNDKLLTYIVKDNIFEIKIVIPKN